MAMGSTRCNENVSSKGRGTTCFDTQVEVRYNETCKFYQPPRAHHCSVTNDCIERFDHFCPWVGTPIGLRNYRTFFTFILLTVSHIFICVVCKGSCCSLAWRRMLLIQTNAHWNTGGVARLCHRHLRLTFRLPLQRLEKYRHSRRQGHAARCNRRRAYHGSSHSLLLPLPPLRWSPVLLPLLPSFVQPNHI